MFSGSQRANSSTDLQGTSGASFIFPNDTSMPSSRLEAHILASADSLCYTFFLSWKISVQDFRTYATVFNAHLSEAVVKTPESG